MGRKQKRKKDAIQTGRLRIVAGKWRSRLLPIAVVDGLRPTGERIRETLFNWLQDTIVGSHCLDLFAGTGALGLEALSRGAESVVFVDQSQTAVDTLQNCVESLGAKGAEIIQDDAMSFLNHSADQKYDLVFLDPPFANDLAKDLCRLLAEGDWLQPGAKVYLEQHLHQTIPDLPNGWRLLKEKTTGLVRYALISVK